MQTFISDSSFQEKPYPDKPLVLTGWHRDAHPLPLELFLLSYKKNGEQRDWLLDVPNQIWG